MQVFHEAIDFCGLKDVGFTGYKFMWLNSRRKEDNVQEQLDRCLIRQGWKKKKFNQ